MLTEIILCIHQTNERWHYNVTSSVVGWVHAQNDIYADLSEISQLQTISSQNVYYHQVSNISRTLVGNTIVDHSDLVAASPFGAAPTTSSFPT